MIKRKRTELNWNLENYFDCVIIVEGEKDVRALKSLGFEHVYTIHRNKVSVRERIEDIVSRVGRDKMFCVLTDLDLAGRKLYSEVLNVLQELGARVDNRLRDLLFESGVSHVEGLKSFVNSLVK